MIVNRRGFIKSCLAALGGVCVAFLPSKKKPNCSPIIPAFTGVEDSIEPDLKRKDIDNIWVSAERNPICPICDREMYLSLISTFPSTQFYKCEKSPHYWTYDKEMFLTDLHINGEKVHLLT